MSIFKDTVKLIQGDCLAELKLLPDDSVDALVCDPPAGISFMFSAWDSDKGGREHWIAWLSEVMRECLRIMKPGAHGFVWALPRTSHWTGTALEDAGFEVRDVIVHIFGQGFPKSTNVLKSAEKQGLVCNCNEETQYQMQSVSDINIQVSKLSGEDQKSVLLNGVPKQILPEQGQSEQVPWGEKSVLEGRALHRTAEGLCNDKNAQSFKSEAKRLCVGAHTSDGKASESVSQGNRSYSSHQSQSKRQSDREFETVCKSQRALGGTSQRGLHCSECGKLKKETTNGLGTATKPANEHWILVRKPLSEKTVAKNVLKYSTGAIHVDVSRVESVDKFGGGVRPTNSKSTIYKSGHGSYNKEGFKQSTQGRFPANIIVSGDAREVLDEQSGVSKSTPFGNPTCGFHDSLGRERKKRKDGSTGHSDSGGASRYFFNGADPFLYCAKSSKKDRNSNGVVNNTHSTVKPQKLMRYLCKMITPPDGVILDPFMGSGSTGVAALADGFGFIGIEQDEEYFNIAHARIVNAEQSR